MSLTEIDRDARAILLTAKDILTSRGRHASYSDAVRFLAYELGLKADDKHLASELAKDIKCKRYLPRREIEKREAFFLFDRRNKVQ